MRTTRAFHQIKHGRVKATIWHEVRDGVTRFHVAFTRLFNNHERWWDSTCFHRDDMPAVRRLAEDAHAWISLQSQDQSQADGEGGIDGTS